MGSTVFAETMGLFHKGSGGFGVAPGDVCLSPPTPPAGPMPVPYVNNFSAGDLTKGSRSVSVEGNPTALENVSEVSTSVGDEPGTQGGGVVTHKTKGKASCKLWSFVVKVEGKGVCCHGHPAGQNSASDLHNSVDTQVTVNFLSGISKKNKEADCPAGYDRNKHYEKPTDDQTDSVQKQACWQCKSDLADLKKQLKSGARVKTVVDALEKKIARQESGKDKMVADHQPPVKVAWEMGGCHMGPTAFKTMISDKKYKVLPHCRRHQAKQGGAMAGIGQRRIWDFMNAKVPGLAI